VYADLILGILVLCAISAVLALLLEVADSYLADYGEKLIRVNDQKDLLVKAGRPLLSTLMEEGLFIPSACGGRGTCAYCKVKVMEGGGPVLPTETPYLSPSELEGHVRLSCQVKVKDDLRIQIPEELFLVREFRARVIQIQDLTPQIKGLRLRILSPPEGIRFTAGQYVQLEVPRYKHTSGPEYRAYSIASGPQESVEFELVVTRVPEGAVTTYVHDYLKEGEELRVTGPFGEFRLRDSDRDRVLIATGSGLAPFLSMLHQIEGEPREGKTTLFFGARTGKDLYYLPELRGFAEKIPRFTFIPTLSRPTEEDHWEGEKGRVTNLIEKHVQENAEVDAYLCGSPDMVESCIAVLKRKGIPGGRIFFDKFE
jgi:Na+-transporting NADH:ubiquinone oxidoreductase subunit F